MGRKRSGRYRRATARSEKVAVKLAAGGNIVSIDDMGGIPQHRIDRGDVVRVGRTLSAGGQVVRSGWVNSQESFVSWAVFNGLLGEGITLSRRRVAIDWMLESFHEAGLTPRVSARYQTSGTGGSPEMPTKQALAFERMLLVFDYLPDDAVFLESVVCWGVRVGTEGITRLAEALDRLHAKLPEIEDRLRSQKSGRASRPRPLHMAVPDWVDRGQRAHEDVDSP